MRVALITAFFEGPAGGAVGSPTGAGARASAGYRALCAGAEGDPPRPRGGWVAGRTAALPVGYYTPAPCRLGVESVRTASIFTGSSCGQSGRMRACEADEVRQFAPRGDMLGSRPAAYGRRVEPRAGSGGGEWQSAPAVSSPLA